MGRLVPRAGLPAPHTAVARGSRHGRGPSSALLTAAPPLSRCAQTPSLVPPRLLGRILSSLRARFGAAAGAEVTIEADPGTFDAALLAEYRSLGFTRLSMGVQSFQEVRMGDKPCACEAG